MMPLPRLGDKYEDAASVPGLVLHGQDSVRADRPGVNLSLVPQALLRPFAVVSIRSSGPNRTRIRSQLRRRAVTDSWALRCEEICVARPSAFSTGIASQPCAYSSRASLDVSVRRTGVSTGLTVPGSHSDERLAWNLRRVGWVRAMRELRGDATMRAACGTPTLRGRRADLASDRVSVCELDPPGIAASGKSRRRARDRMLPGRRRWSISTSGCPRRCAPASCVPSAIGVEAPDGIRGTLAFAR